MTRRKGTGIILALARRARNLELLRTLLEQEGYEARVAQDIPTFDQLLETSGEPTALAILDIDGFTQEVWDLCARLEDRTVPFLVLTSVRDQDVQQEALRRGSRSVLEKPVTRSNLVTMLRTLV